MKTSAIPIPRHKGAHATTLVRTKLEDAEPHISKSSIIYLLHFYLRFEFWKGNAQGNGAKNWNLFITPVK